MSKSTFELRQLAGIDIQSIAQTAKLLSAPDAATYLDYVTIGIHTLRKGAVPAIEDNKERK